MQVDTQASALAMLRDMMESIRQYADDTLSGRADAPEDVKWHREGMREIRSRAIKALAQIKTLEQ